MKYFFILGRNPKLSREEIFSYLEARKVNFSEVVFESNLLVIESYIKIPIQNLGGTIFSGNVLFEGNISNFEDYLKNNEIVESDKFSYSVFGNVEPDLLKEKFKKERKKAVLKHGHKKISFQEGNSENFAKADFYLFLYSINNKVYLGLVNQIYEYTSLKKRDMEKPIRREELAISPRLSKILINLSEAKSGDLLLDPFCGVGAILSEALVLGINVFGIDKDSKAIKDAEKNIIWLKSEFDIKAKEEIKNMDSKGTPRVNCDAVATETPLGKLQKHKISNSEAKKVISDFEGIIIPILRRIKVVKKKNARIAITFPKVKEFSVDYQKISERTGLKVVLKPIEESRKGQFIGREILVFA